jgi:hypothetical protein
MLELQFASGGIGKILDFLGKGIIEIGIKNKLLGNKVRMRRLKLA